MIEVTWVQNKDAKDGYAHITDNGKKVGWLRLEGEVAFNFFEHLIEASYMMGKQDGIRIGEKEQ